MSGKKECKEYAGAWVMNAAERDYVNVNLYMLSIGGYQKQLNCLILPLKI